MSDQHGGSPIELPPEHPVYPYRDHARVRRLLVDLSDVWGASIKAERWANEARERVADCQR